MTARGRGPEIIALADLGMDGTRAVLLLDHFGDLDAVFAADYDELTEVTGVAEATAARIQAAAAERSADAD